MSGLARAAKKHWKRKVKAFKKYWKVVAIAVAAYFTFGLALGAFAPAAGTVAAGTGAATTGAGVMTATAATATSSAATAAAAAGTIETVTVTAAAGGGISAAGAAGAAAAGGAAAYTAAKPAPKPEAQQAPQTQQPPPAPAASSQPSTGLIDKAKAGWKEMSFSDKLLLAKAGVDIGSAVAAPSPEEEAALAKKWQGAFYGATASEAEGMVGKTQFVTQQTAPQQRPGATAGGKVGQRDIVGGSGPGTPTAPEGQAQPGQALPPTQQMQFQSTAEQPTTTPQQTPEQVTNVGGNRDLFAQRAPGVRYLV